MKIAIVHDFLKEYGGAERVVEVLHEIYPDAPIYTAFVDYDGLGPHADRIRKWKIITTWAQNVPFITKLYSPLRFLAPFFFRSLDLSNYDIIISSTNAYYAKGVIKRSSTRHPEFISGSSEEIPKQVRNDKRRNQIHICYCHTPTRSLYGYTTAMNWKKNPAIRAYGTIVNHFLRLYDFKAAQKVNYFIANSEEVKQRIKKFYRRDVVVIYPPVTVNQNTQQVSKSASQSNQNHRQSDTSDSPKHRLTDFYLYVGKLAYTKHVDLAIEAANRLKISLKIVGKGREEEQLRRMAGPTVEFLGEVSDEELHKLYTQSRALIFPAQDEDFGIVPVEAMAYGVPVIAHRSGGVVESVVEEKTGYFFDELTVDSVVDAIKKLNDSNHLIKQEDCIKQAQKFSKERFRNEITRIVADLHG